MTDSSLKNSASGSGFGAFDPSQGPATIAASLIILVICCGLIVSTVFYGAVHQPIIALFHLSAASIALLWAFDAFFTGAFRFNASLLQIPLISLIMYGVIQIIPFGSLAAVAGVSGIPGTISADPYSTRLFVVHVIALATYFCAALAFLDQTGRIKKVFYTIFVFGFLFAFFAIIQSVLSPAKIYGIYEPKNATPFGSFVNRHNFAAFMEMSLALPLGMLFAGAIKPDKRLLYITAAGLMGVALILSGSRGGFISLVAMLFFLVFITKASEGGQGLLLKMLLAAAMIATIIFGAALVGGESSLTRIAETAASQDISTNRTHIWQVTLKVIRENWILGAGLGAFGVAYTPYDSMNGIERVEQAHNDYLQVAADAGLIGLAIGAFFLFAFFKAGFGSLKTKNEFRRGVAAGAFAGCFAVLVHSLFDFVLHTTAVSILFLCLLALMVASGRKHPEDAATISKGKRKKRASVASLHEIKMRRDLR